MNEIDETLIKWGARGFPQALVIFHSKFKVEVRTQGTDHIGIKGHAQLLEGTLKTYRMVVQ